MVRCPYRYRCDWFTKRVRPYFCKIAITLIAKVALRVAKKDSKIRSDSYLQYPDYKDICQKGYQRDYGIFCDILRNLSPLLVGTGTEGHVYQKYIFFFGRIKDKIWFLTTLKDGISLK